MTHPPRPEPPEPGSAALDRRTFLAWTSGAALVGIAGVACAADPDGQPAAQPAGATPSGTDTPTTAARPAGTDPPGTDPPLDPQSVATQAFLAGVPLLVTRRTMATFAAIAGTNTLLHPPGLGNPSSRLVVAPNHDTVYALAVIDLRAGPLLLTMPAIEDRYHVMQFLDAWMGGFGLLGTRTTGGRAGTWVIAPAGWDGEVPDGAEVLESPTPDAVLLGRIRAVDDADALDAAALGRQIVLEPLTGAPPIDADASATDPFGPPAGPPGAVGADGAAAFDELGDALVADPPVTPEQRAALDAAAPLGIGPGLHPSGDPAIASLLADAVTDALAAMVGGWKAGSTNHNGWDTNLALGTGDTDQGLEARATVARFAWGPVPAEEAIYASAAAGSDGEPLDGSKRYRIRFGPGGQPPVDAFWSVTAYGPDRYLVVNDVGRYSIGGDTPGLVTGPDGSLELQLQHEPPAAGPANWLPVPPGPFTLILRMYLPRSAIVDGTYAYPSIDIA